MNRKIGFTIVLSFLLCFSCLIAFEDQLAKVNALILLDDDFNSLDGWTTSIAGGWNVSEGVLHGWAPIDHGSWIWKGDTSWMNYRVTAKISLTSGSEATIIFRYKDASNFYIIGLGSWNHKYSISKVVGFDTNVTELASLGLKSEVEVDTWYTVTAVAFQDYLQMYVDGARVLDVHDSSHPNGAVGLRTWNGTMEADNITVESDQVFAPEFNPPEGIYFSSQNVEISCGTIGATIRYTLDGYEPTSSSTLYSGPISISSTTTIKAKAFKSDMADSDTVSATYNIELDKVSTPFFSPSGGNYSSAQSVTISCATGDATIRYTLDGYEPTSSSTLYSGPISINGMNIVVKAKAFKEGLEDSETAVTIYSISISAVDGLWIQIAVAAIMIISPITALALWYKKKNQNPLAGLLPLGWQFYSKPTTGEPPGTIFRISPDKKKFSVKQLDVPIHPCEESVGKYTRKTTMDILIRFTGLTKIDIQGKARKIQQVVFEMKNPQGETTYDADLDPVLNKWLESPRFEFREGDRYFVIRDATKTKAINYQLTQDQVKVLEETAAFNKKIIKQNVGFSSRDEQEFVLPQEFKEPMRIMFNAEEIKMKLVKGKIKLSHHPVKGVLEWKD